MGDFNHMKDNLLKRYPLTQTVKSSTHGTSILDCVYSNISKYYATPTIHPGLGLCHHFSVICTPLNLKPNRKAVIITKRVFTHGAKSKFTEQLKCVNWIPLYKLASCQQQWEYFHGIMLSLLDKYLPIQTSVKYETDKPWITSQFNPIRSGGGFKSPPPLRFFALTHLILELHYCALVTFPKK